MCKRNVTIFKSNSFSYPKEAPFRPHIKHPEYPFKELSKTENKIYESIRDAFLISGFDSSNFNTPSWNPLGAKIKPGDSVLIKPNLVMDVNQSQGKGTDCLYTNPSLVAAVVDYVSIALHGRGKIVVGDAPMQECDFDNLLKNSGYDKLTDFYIEKFRGSGITFELVDFRELKSEAIKGVYHSHISKVYGTVVDLKENSEFSDETDYFYKNERITNYDPSILKKHHNKNVNEYYINNYVLSADVIINMPKPKTHRKAGVTISLKNMVGICCRKEYLPHHTNGSVAEGGDEYLNKSIIKKCLDRICDRRNYLFQTKRSYTVARLYKKLYNILLSVSEKLAKDNFYEGSWYGNNTICKTIVDLNKIVLYCGKDGHMHSEKQREYLIVADMIISGECEGPVAPSPKNVGIIAIGDDPVCFDEAILWFMGAKKEYINTVNYARRPIGNHKITEPDSKPFILSNKKEIDHKTIDDLSVEEKLYFQPTSGWKEAFFHKPNN